MNLIAFIILYCTILSLHTVAVLVGGRESNLWTLARVDYIFALAIFGVTYGFFLFFGLV